MNILHIVMGRPKPETSNGVLKSVYSLSLNQGKLGHKVDVLSIRNKESEPSVEVSENVMIHLYKRHPLRFVLDGRLVNFIASNFQSIDMVHLHGGYHPEYWRASTILNKYRIPYLISPCGGYQKIANKRNYFLKKIYKKLFEMNVVNNAKYIHALNIQEADEIKSYGVEQSKIIIIPNGVDVGEIKTIKAKISDDELDSSKFSLVYCGRIDAYYKGLDVLLKAINILVNERNKKNIELKLIGPDWKSSKGLLEKLIDDMVLDDYVEFYGAKYGLEKYEIYSSSSVFILPSRTEGMPTSVLEAMAFSMPCIVTPETNLDKRIMEFGGCYFVELSPGNIADAVEKFMSDKAALHEMGLKGLEWVERNYTYSKVTEQHISHYRNELSQLKNEN